MVSLPHSALWEVPLPALTDETFAAVTIQDPPGSKEQIVALLKRNFGSVSGSA